ncbi:Type I restriction-modification system specificity subunit (plasmid) [Roseomonas mucosa]|uniref:Type I restriction-modification system specificity subunit n=1 Tax=Roseomonas mucosa TaxID=207340 RepID=A0A4Y1MPU4_9PROT|nr:Type I restriction-modification system specificity subunit [Roseomonas mucosa]
MNPAHLLAHFETISEAPDAIRHLRRFILDLAVRGKLVPQDGEDEPASELLRQIRLEKSRLENAGVIKKEKVLSEIGNTDIFDIPSTWCWTRLGTVTSYIQRGKSPKYATADGAPVVSQRCIQWDGLNLSAAKQITLESLNDYEDLRFLRDGDLLWNSTGTGTIGRIVRVVNPPEKLVCDSHVTIVRCLIADPEYIRTWLRSDHVYALIEDRAAGSTNQVELTAQMAINQVLPLPPLAEQHRIVARVDELMALCDQLEAQRCEREARRDRVASASLARLNAPEPETFKDDVGFTLNALPPLTSRPEQIKQLRQTILNLALRGKLTRQEPSDDPVSVLLQNVSAAKSLMVQRGRVRETLPLLRKVDSDISQSLPDCWDFVAVSDLAYLRSGVALEHSEEQASGDLPYVKVADLSISANRDGIVTSSRFVSMARADAAIEAGSIVFPKRGGAIATNRKLLSQTSVICDSNLMAMKPFLDAMLPYLYMWFGAFDLWKLNSGTSVPQINNKDIYPLPVPLPPLAEQHRIVAKVHEIMTLCDQLEASLRTRDEARHGLLTSVLAEALQPPDEREEAA